MRRIRSIKPEFFTSEDIAALPLAVRLTFIGLWLYVDDYGNENANASLIKAQVWPLDDDVTTATVDDHLLQLCAGGQIELYTVGKRTYLSIVNWDKHQRVDRPSKSNVPPPPVDPDALATPSRDSRDELAGEGKGEGEGEGEPEGARERGSGERAGDGGGTSRVPHEKAPGLPPSPFCQAHPDGTDDPCRPCGNARRRHDMWVSSRASVTVSFDDPGVPDRVDADEWQQAS